MSEKNVYPKVGERYEALTGTFKEVWEVAFVETQSSMSRHASGSVLVFVERNKQTEVVHLSMATWFNALQKLTLWKISSPPNLEKSPTEHACIDCRHKVANEDGSIMRCTVHTREVLDRVRGDRSIMLLCDEVRGSLPTCPKFVARPRDEC